MLECQFTAPLLISGMEITANEAEISLESQKVHLMMAFIDDMALACGFVQPLPALQSIAALYASSHCGFMMVHKKSKLQALFHPPTTRPATILLDPSLCWLSINPKLMGGTARAHTPVRLQLKCIFPP
jgi:hypothetical protein